MLKLLSDLFFTAAGAFAIWTIIATMRDGLPRIIAALNRTPIPAGEYHVVPAFGDPYRRRHGTETRGAWVGDRPVVKAGVDHLLSSEAGHRDSRQSSSAR